MSKDKEAMVSVSKSDLVKMHSALVRALRVRVLYEDDQLKMANQAIFQMRYEIEGQANYLFNIGCHA